MSKHAPARVRRWQATAILTLFFIAVAGAAAIGWWYARESPPHQGPIVLITVDGLAAADLPAYGAPPIDTPAIDALAGDAVVFERAYTHSPQTFPAHASLLTGELPFEHGVRDDAGFVLDGSRRTLAELLRNRGFSTGAAVSSFLLRRGTGIDQGFSFFDAQPATGDAPAVTRPGHLTLDAAEEWARAQADRRYFMAVQVRAADADLAVARVVTMLEELRLYDDATIVLVGDRGRVDAPTPLGEETLRVPLLIKQPGREGAGRRVAAPVQHIDLVPTVLDLVRAPAPGHLRGRSLKPVLSDGDERVRPQPVYSEWLLAHYRLGGHPVFALTVNDSRYVRGATEELVRIAPRPPGITPDTLAGEGARAVLPADGLTAADTATEAAPLRATLDRLLADHTIGAARSPIESERVRLALAGYLPGLPPPPAGDALPGIDDRRQQDIAAAHQDAARLVGERRPGAAIRALQAIARAHPEIATVHYQIGVLSLEMGRTAAAIDAWRTAAALRPDAAGIPRAMALALAAAGRIPEARGQVATALELARGGADLAATHQTAARVALAIGDTAAALQSADAAQAADPALPMRAFVEGRLHIADGRYEEAAAVLEDAAALLSQQDAALEGLQLSLGEALTALDRLEDAEAAYREEIRRFPHGLDAYTGLARLYAASRPLEDTQVIVGELLTAIPTPAGYAAAARILTDLGQRARAEALRSEARVRFRGDPSLALLARDTRR